MKKEQKNPATILADFTDTLFKIHPKELYGSVIDFIKDMINPVYAIIQIFDAERMTLVEEKILGYTFDRTTPPRIEYISDIAGSIAAGGELLTSPNGTTDRYVMLFDPDQFNICELRIPFFISKFKIGILNLGKKQAGTRYTITEIDLLRILVNQIAVLRRKFEMEQELKKNHESVDHHQFKPHIVVKSKDEPQDLFGESAQMQRIRELVETVAKEDVPVLITGESGTGKELVARAIHRKSMRAQNAMVTMNCAALPDALVESELFGHEKGAFTGAFNRKKGKFEYADGSTLLLDEIGDMNLQTQAKLLRVLQDGSFQRVGGNKTLYSDVRLLTATNKSLLDGIKEGTFREDLYYRINVVQISLPPLRERGKDVLRMAEYFFTYYKTMYRKNLRIDDRVWEWMMKYDFPGNVRELKNIIERAVVMERGVKITIELMPAARKMNPSPVVPEKEKITLDELEKRYIKSVLEQVNRNKSAAARVLGIARKTLREKIAKYNI